MEAKLQNDILFYIHYYIYKIYYYTYIIFSNIHQFYLQIKLISIFRSVVHFGKKMTSLGILGVQIKAPPPRTPQYHAAVMSSISMTAVDVPVCIVFYITLPVVV